MSDVFRLSANVSVDVDNVTRQLQEVQREVNLNFQNGTTSWDNIKLY